jgi:hypothetical protein
MSVEAVRSKQPRDFDPVNFTVFQSCWGSSFQSARMLARCVHRGSPSPRKSKIMSYLATKDSGPNQPAAATTKPTISNTVFTRLLCRASHERASALRPETAHCRSLISHNRPAVSVS